MAVSVHEASFPNSSNFNSTRNWKYDVFLSFRGKDTRKGFTDHLYHALCRRGFKVFRDDQEVERGEVISQELLKAIEDSLFAIVVVSKNYASSSWCLDELQKILAARDKLEHVIPVFYHVDPSDVRHQRGSFAKAFLMHKMLQRDQNKVQKWRDSLTQLANLSGWDSKNHQHEAELIERVVEELWTKLRCRLPLFGIEWRISQLTSHLKKELNDVQFVGICGLDGIGVGKTIIAS